MKKNRNLDTIGLIVLAEGALLAGAWWVTKDWWLAAGLAFAAITTAVMLAVGRALGRKLNGLSMGAAAKRSRQDVEDE
jgi:membrane protein implicated in regulation of membrane protease activity